MNEHATDRENVLAVMGASLERLNSAQKAGAGDHAEVDAKKVALHDALSWALGDEQELAREGYVDDLAPDAEYMSRNPVISLVQTALNIHAAAHSVSTKFPSHMVGDAVDVVLTTLDYLFKPTHPFLPGGVVPPTALRYPMPDACSIAILGDWGTGSEAAIAVAQQIAKQSPDLVIHIGDVYPSGTPQEAQEHFIDVWKQHGPPKAQYWSLSGNHDMMSKGYGFFEKVVPFCGTQQASFFCIENAHWKIIGLDTAYENHDLYRDQHDWLHAQLADAPSKKKILLTHHQVFSAFDDRPARHKLKDTMRPFIDSGLITAWFWGHEHDCIIYDPTPEYNNIKFRCLGHGGKRFPLEKFKVPKHPTGTPHVWNLPRDKDFAQNGFGLLKLDGTSARMMYIGELGTQWGDIDVLG